MVKKRKRILTKSKNRKKLTVGFETEFFILDKKGKVVNKADILLNQLEKDGKIKIRA